MKTKEKSVRLNPEDRALLEALAKKLINKPLLPKRIEEGREMLRKARFVNGAEKIFRK